MKRALVLMWIAGWVGLFAACGSSPDSTNCEQGKEYAKPGCGDNNNFTAGCYKPCASDTDCGTDETCTSLTVTPACAMSTNPNGAVCGACGEEKKFCMAKSTNTCASGEEYHTPGCNDNAPKIKAGCYKPCTADTDCSGTQTCKDADVTPGCAKNPDPNGSVCGACGMTVKLCQD
ncbi:MAG: hypothetical protein EP343_15375 [Deltaproteobacteria bacterium]|nr:MAG: hypothetical protein EP343_15375 [Deltaproteobacteria bacterium]